MNRFPKLETQRLILSHFSPADIPEIVEYAGNKKIADVTLNIPHPYAVKDAIHWINTTTKGFVDNTQITFRIGLKSTNELIGAMGLILKLRFDRAELGYWIGEPFWNKGYATEAAGAVLQFGIEILELNKIYATHLAENPASGKVMLKNGMIKEGELVEHTKKGNQYKTLIQYRLTKREYASNNL